MELNVTIPEGSTKELKRKFGDDIEAIRKYVNKFLRYYNAHLMNFDNFNDDNDYPDFDEDE